MADEKQLEILQGEIKLLKGELKNSLASVRDYLLNMELPSSEFSTILAALSGDEAAPQRMNVESRVVAKGDEIAEPTFEEEAEEEPEEVPGEEEKPAEDEDLLDFDEPGNEEATTEELPEESTIEEENLPEGETLTEEESLPEGEEISEELPENELPPEEEVEEEEEVETEEDNIPEESEELPELPLEEAPSMEYDQATNEINQGIPKVNMLANLINWVARARQDIGYEQLPTFLEVYGISGHLSPELKEVIIHLADIAKEYPEVTAESEIWSQAMLSLHGILTGGDAPQNAVIPSWVDADETESPNEDEIIEIDKAKEKRAQLKLVFPNGDGKSKEFCIDLKPEENGDGDGAS